MPSTAALWDERLRRASRTSLAGKSILCAYNALVDRQVFLSRKQLQTAADDASRATPYEPKEVFDEKTFAEALLFFFSKGKAGHKLVTKEFASALTKTFPKHRRRLGGQAGIVSSQLARLGANSAIYAPFRPPETFKLLNEKVLFPLSVGGKLAMKSARNVSREGDPQKTNWIFEFEKGQKARVQNKTVRCPRSNRLILATPFPGAPEFDAQTEKILPQLGKRLDCVMLAGHHYLLPRYANGRTFHYYVEKEERAVRLMKKSNPRLRAHVEYVPFAHAEIEERVMEHVTENIDSLGLNEVELVQLCGKIGARKQAAAIRADENAFTLYEGALAVLDKLKMQRVHVHAPGLHVLALRKPYPIAVDKVRNAALYSSLAATTKAILGREFSLPEMKVSFKEPVSRHSLAQLPLFARKAGPACRDFELEGVWECGDHYALVVPGPFYARSAGTVGLGDVVSSCAFLAEA